MPEVSLYSSFEFSAVRVSGLSSPVYRLRAVQDKGRGPCNLSLAINV